MFDNIVFSQNPGQSLTVKTLKITSCAEVIEFYIENITGKSVL